MTEDSQRKRLSVNKVFGDSLPETTKDEWDDDPASRADDRDDWLRENIPPHHG